MHQFRNTLHNAPACERSLNRHRYHAFRKFLSIQRQITAIVLEIQKNVNMLFYRKFNKPWFLSEHFFCISFRDIGEPLKKCTLFPRLRLECNRFWRGLLICSMGSRIKHEYQNSDFYRLMFLFVENLSNLTGLLWYFCFPTQGAFQMFYFLLF